MKLEFLVLTNVIVMKNKFNSNKQTNKQTEKKKKANKQNIYILINNKLQSYKYLLYYL